MPLLLLLLLGRMQGVLPVVALDELSWLPLLQLPLLPCMLTCSCKRS